MFNWLFRLLSSSSDNKPAAPAPARAAVAPPAPAPKVQNIVTHAALSTQRDQMDFVFSSWLFEAENHPDVFTNGNEDAILAALDATVKSGESGAHMVRRMPGVIPQLLQSLRNSDFAGAELARTISHDVVLVAEVLRMANSAAYNPGAPITSIDHAILILGQNGLRQLITGVAFKPIIDLKSGNFTRMVAPRLWAQSERCASACALLAKSESVDPLDAFLAGLIHNVGLTVSLRVIDKISDGRQPVGSPTFCNALAAYGRSLTVNIAREWHFPDAVTTAIAEQDDKTPGKNISSLGRVLMMADHLSKIDTLSRHGQADANGVRVQEDLTEKEIDCLRWLAAEKERDWIAITSARQ
ncbi:MAG TPA: HDOD domain-containing protein [Noviherbaspirillum sp.]|nr:HDOD domain-containing protein [Noviherbaspirillum sp.]